MTIIFFIFFLFKFLMAAFVLFDFRIDFETMLYENSDTFQSR